jgi:hypothetical protein
MAMLFQPAGDGAFQRACEADGWRGLVAAIIGDPGYELADPETRLVARLRLAHDIAFLAGLLGRPEPTIGDSDSGDTINVASDGPMLRSLDRLGLVSLEPGLR